MRVGIAEAAARLGLSADSIRRRVRAGTLPAQRDNRGVWRVEVPEAGAPMQPPMQPAAMPMVAPTYAAPMQAPNGAGEAAALRELVDLLRAQLAKAEARLDASEAERGRLLALVETLTAREPTLPKLVSLPDPELLARADAAERTAAELRAVLDGELAGLRAMVERLRTGPAENIAPARRFAPARARRPGLLRRLLGG